MSKTTILAATAATGLAGSVVPATLLSSSIGSNERIGNEQIETIKEEVIDTSKQPIAEQKKEVPVKQETPSQPISKPKPVSKFTKPTWTSKFIPQMSLAQDIKNEYLKVGCLKSYFTEIKFNTAKASKPTSNEIKEFSADSQSCLIVEYYKQTYTDNKWWGEFRLIWAVKDNVSGQGLITVTNARTVEGKFKGSSSAYALKKDSSGNSWTASHKKEVGESDKDNAALERLIPQATSSIPESLDTTDYWGFNPTLTNICKNGNCEKTNGQATHNSYYWEFIKNGENAIVHFWAANIKDWLEKIFGWEVFENKMYKIKGKWQVKQG